MFCVVEVNPAGTDDHENTFPPPVAAIVVLLPHVMEAEDVVNETVKGPILLPNTCISSIVIPGSVPVPAASETKRKPTYTCGCPSTATGNATEAN